MIIISNPKIIISNFPAVSNTALMTLYARAMDYQLKNPILKDQFSYDLYHRIEFDWSPVKKTLRSIDYTLLPIRIRKFDRMCQQFLSNHPKGIVVSLGAGVDYRFGRIDNGQFTFIEIDFPEVCEFKKKIIPISPRNFFLGQSVLDFSWIRHVQDLANSMHEQVFLIAEGLMCWLDKDEMHKLLENMCTAFPHSELFFDVMGEKGINMLKKKRMIKDWNVKVYRGINTGHDLEAWGVGFKLISEWFLSDDPDAKRGIMKLFWWLMKTPTIQRLVYCIYGKTEP